MTAVQTGFLALLIASGLQGCASTPDASVMSVDALVREAGQLEGRQIRVRGAVSFYFQHGTAQLWASSEAIAAVSTEFVPPDDSAWDRCVDLDFRPAMTSRLQQRDGKNADIVGILHANPRQPGDVNLGSCSELLLVVQTLR